MTERRKRTDDTPIFGEPLLNLHRKIAAGNRRCVGVDTTDFFSEIPRIQERVIKKFCSKCPVKEPCLQLGVELQATGIWGGQTEDQRKAERRNQLRRLKKQQKLEIASAQETLTNNT